MARIAVYGGPFSPFAKGGGTVLFHRANKIYSMRMK